MRTTSYLSKIRCFYLLYCLSFLFHKRYTYKYGIDIAHDTKIGPGLYIGHFGGIIVNYGTVIGKNCNISPGVVIGQTNRGKKKGLPVIGDNVFIATGAKILGNIHVGNHVAIGANAVVVHDVPENAVIGGIPGKIISFKGSEGYINRIDYN